MTDEQYDRTHDCPSCSRGPWKTLWALWIEQAWNRLTPAEQQREIEAALRKERALKAFAKWLGIS